MRRWLTSWTYLDIGGSGRCRCFLWSHSHRCMRVPMCGVLYSLGWWTIELLHAELCVQLTASRYEHLHRKLTLSGQLLLVFVMLALPFGVQGSGMFNGLPVLAYSPNLCSCFHPQPEGDSGQPSQCPACLNCYAALNSQGRLNCLATPSSSQ